jgi:hypothetical protein
MLTDNFPSGGGLDINGYRGSNIINGDGTIINEGDIVQITPSHGIGGTGVQLPDANGAYCTMLNMGNIHNPDTSVNYIFCAYSGANNMLTACILKTQNGAWSVNNVTRVGVPTDAVLAGDPIKLYQVRNDCVLVVYGRGNPTGINAKCMHVIPDQSPGVDYIGQGSDYQITAGNNTGFDVCGLDSEHFSHRVLICGLFAGNHYVVACRIQDFSITSIGTKLATLPAMRSCALSYIRPGQAYLACTLPSTNIVSDRVITVEGVTPTIYALVSGPQTTTIFQNGVLVLGISRLTEFTYVIHYFVPGLKFVASHTITVSGDPVTAINRLGFALQGAGSDIGVGIGGFTINRETQQIYGVVSYGTGNTSPSKDCFQGDAIGFNMSFAAYSRTALSGNQMLSCSIVQIAPYRCLIPKVNNAPPYIEIINADFVPVVSPWDFWKGTRPGVAITAGVGGDNRSVAVVTPFPN